MGQKTTSGAAAGGCFLTRDFDRRALRRFSSVSILVGIATLHCNHANLGSEHGRRAMHPIDDRQRPIANLVVNAA
jgi:hypothetical protein